VSEEVKLVGLQLIAMIAIVPAAKKKPDSSRTRHYPVHLVVMAARALI
jgi:hypothetical protein